MSSYHVERLKQSINKRWDRIKTNLDWIAKYRKEIEHTYEDELSTNNLVLFVDMMRANFDVLRRLSCRYPVRMYKEEILMIFLPVTEDRAIIEKELYSIPGDKDG